MDFFSFLFKIEILICVVSLNSGDQSWSDLNVGGNLNWDFHNYSKLERSFVDENPLCRTS